METKHMIISETYHRIVLSMWKIFIYIPCTIRSIYIYKNILLRLPSSQTSASHRYITIPLPKISQASQVNSVVYTSLHYFSLGDTFLNRDRPHDLCVESGVVKPYIDGRRSTGQSKTKHKCSFLGGSTSLYSMVVK